MLCWHICIESWGSKVVTCVSSVSTRTWAIVSAFGACLLAVASYGNYIIDGIEFVKRHERWVYVALGGIGGIWLAVDVLRIWNARRAVFNLKRDLLVVMVKRYLRNKPKVRI
jgi:hypothetical protein